MKIGRINTNKTLQGFGALNYSPRESDMVTEATSANGGLEVAASALKRIMPELVILEQELRQATAVAARD